MKNEACPVCACQENHPYVREKTPFHECAECGLLFQSLPRRLSALNRAYGDDGSRAEQLIREEPRRRAYYQRHLKRIQAFAPEAGSLLEVAFGGGGLLEAFKRAGWRIEGVEPSRALYEYASRALGAEAALHRCALEEASGLLRQVPYDLVIALDAIEHFADPFLLPRMAHSLLKPGGLLYLQTPNTNSLRCRLEKEAWEQLAPEEHLCLHTMKSLAMLLEACGFGIRLMRTTSGAGSDTLMRRLLKTPIQLILNAAGLGNGLIVLAEKRSACSTPSH